MACARRLEGKKIRSQCVFVGSAIGPKRAPGLPICTQAFVMGDRVLNDEGLDALGMSQGHAKTHGSTVILHVERVSRESQRLGEVIDDLSDVIEGVRTILRLRPIA